VSRRRASRRRGYLYKVAWGLRPLFALYEGKVLGYYVASWCDAKVAEIKLVNDTVVKSEFLLVTLRDNYHRCDEGIE